MRINPIHEFLGEPADVTLNEDAEDLGIGTDMKGWDKKEKGPKKIAFSFYLEDIYSVVTDQELFKPKMSFNFDWVDDGALARSDETSKKTYWQGGYKLKAEGENLFGPVPYILNAVEDYEPETWIDVYLIHGRPVISHYMAINTELRSQLNVRNFPFDVQELSVKIGSNYWLTSDVEFVFDGDVNDQKALMQKCVGDLVFQNAEYTLLGIKIDTYEHLFPNLQRYDFQEEGYPEIEVKFVFARNALYYLRGIFMIINLVLIVGSIPFWCQPDDTGARFSISTTMLLTLVAFHFVVMSSLPKVSYSTRLDRWLSICYALLFFSNAENVVMLQLSWRLPEVCDEYCFMIDGIVFGAYLLVLLLNGLWFVSPLLFGYEMPKDSKKPTQKTAQKGKDVEMRKQK